MKLGRASQSSSSVMPTNARRLEVLFCESNTGVGESVLVALLRPDECLPRVPGLDTAGDALAPAGLPLANFTVFTLLSSACVLESILADASELEYRGGSAGLFGIVVFEENSGDGGGSSSIAAGWILSVTVCHHQFDPIRGLLPL